MAISAVQFGCKKEIEEKVIPPAPPKASLTISPTNPEDINTIISFDASQSHDTNDVSSTLQVRFDFNHDGIYDTDWSTNKKITHTYSIADLNTQKQVRAGVIVLDKDDMTDTISKLISFNLPIPTGQAVVSPLSGDQLTTFHFDASQIHDGFGNDSVKIRWDFGNDGTWSNWKWKSEGGPGLGFEFGYNGFSYDGNYQIAYEVVDQFESTIKDTMSIELVKLPPYEIINIEEGHVFSGIHSTVRIRILSNRDSYYHRLFLRDANNTEYSVSQFESFAGTEIYITPNLSTTGLEDGNYTLYAQCINTGGGVVYESQEINVVCDNNGMAKLNVFEPSTSAVWEPGESALIKWQPVMSGTQVVIILFSQSSKEMIYISQSAPNTGTYGWNVPSDLALGSYMVYISVLNNVGKGFSEIFDVYSVPPLAVIDYYGPFGDVAGIDFVNSSPDIHYVDQNDPYKIETIGNNIVATEQFWEETSGSMPQYGGFAFASNGSDYYVVRSSTGTSAQNPSLLKIDGNNPQNVLAARRFESVSGAAFTFDDVCLVGSYLYAIDDYYSEIWKLSASDLSMSERIDVSDIRVSSGDKITGITYGGGNFWAVFSNKYAGGSGYSQVVKLNSNFSVVNRFNLPNTVNPTSIQYNPNNGHLYLGATNGIYKLAKE